jgi:cytochrome c oxidase assembly protein subunit 15
LLFVLTLQAGVGYVQYAADVPVGLVAVHILGAVSVWIATLHFALSLRSPARLQAPEPDLVELS